MSTTTETEILDRLYGAIGEAKKWSKMMSSPIRLRTLTTDKTDYEHLYDTLEIIEGCARQMTAWREDTRWLAVSKHIGLVVTKLREWSTMDNLPLFIALVDFLDKTAYTCRNLQIQSTGRVGMILPDVIVHRGSHVAPRLVAVTAPGTRTIQ